MAQSREIVHEVDLEASGGADTAYVWDAPSSVPFRNITVIISSGGVIWPASDLEWEIFYTTKWTGVPFQSGSTPGTGLSQASGTIAAVQAFTVAWEDATILPSNMPQDLSVLSKSGRGGAAVVCELVNKKAVPIKVFVTFISEILSER